MKLPPASEVGATLRRVKPGWYVLALLLVYAVVTTVSLSRANAELRELRRAEAARIEAEAAEAARPRPPQAPEGLWIPVPGAAIPDEPLHLPGAPRPYRQGVNQGFDFYADEVGVPVRIGTPVVAAAPGTVVRADVAFEEMTPERWDALLERVAAEGASEEELDELRGRQVWIEGVDGRVYRYAHLSGVRPGLQVGDPVYRGRVIGYVGNSGTEDGVRGADGGARLHFEIWDGDGFFGQGMDAAEVRIAAAELFTGP